MSKTNVCMFTSTRAMPYVYMLVHRITGQFYIGYREANNLPADQDLTSYGTSSKYVAALGMSSFDWSIIAEFYDGRDAYDFEQQLIREHRTNPLILNRHFLTASNKRLRYIRPKGTYIASEETRLKLSRAHVGRVKSTETRKRLSAALTGREFSAEHKANIGQSSRGRKHTDKTKAIIGSHTRGTKREPFSTEWKANISKAQRMRDRTNEIKRGSACTVLGQNYNSISEASRALQWTRAKVRTYLDSH